MTNRGRTFDGRDIVKTIVNIGVAGEIELTDILPSLSTVTFQARARVGAVKHVFKDDGTVKEQVILSLDPDSFEILGIQKSAEQKELPLNTGTVTVEQTDQIAKEMGLKGPLLVSCEGCGHGKGDHEDIEGDHVGPCLVASCQCQGYVPFAEAPAEEELEPVAEGGEENGEAVESPVDAWPASEPMPVEMAEPAAPERPRKRGRKLHVVGAPA